MTTEKDPDTSIAAEELIAFIERVERLEEEKKGIMEDIKGVYAEMKGRGFDVKVVRDIVKERAKDRDERHEHAAIFEVYAAAVGLD